MSSKLPVLTSHGYTSGYAGLPSGWLPRGKQDDFALQLKVKRLQDDLVSRDLPLRERAAETLAELSKGEHFALALTSDLKPLLRALRPCEPQAVKLAILQALRSLAEKGHAVLVAQHSYALLGCLKDSEILVQRKASALYRVLAEEGAAAMVAQDVASLMSCFEASSARGAALSAPLDALSAIAVAGEAKAVTAVIDRLFKGLRDPRGKIRCSTCATLGSIASSGGKELVGSLGLCAAGETSKASLFELLVCLALDDPDDEVRLEAAQALQCLPQADPETCDQTRRQFPQLVLRLRRQSPRRGPRTRRGEARKMVSDAMGLEDLEPKLDGLCAICQEPLCGAPFDEFSVLHCGHLFHQRCAQSWFEWQRKCGRMGSCPVCRSLGHGKG